MHHRRSRTTRREVKRMDNKAFRAAEARALNRGVEDHPPQDRWGYRPEPLPLGDVPCNGKAHGKKKAHKPKDKCPVNRTHEWYKEVRDEDHTYLSYYRNRLVTEQRTYKVRTCIHCWKEIKVRVFEPYRYSYRKLVLPKRSVQF